MKRLGLPSNNAHSSPVYEIQTPIEKEMNNSSCPRPCQGKTRLSPGVRPAFTWGNLVWGVLGRLGTCLPFCLPAFYFILFLFYSYFISILFIFYSYFVMYCIVFSSFLLSFPLSFFALSFFILLLYSSLFSSTLLFYIFLRDIYQDCG